MKKARILLILALIMLVMTMLVACGEKPGQGGDTEHLHNFIEKQDSQYLKSAATCETAVVYYKSCSICGIKSEQTYVYGTALGHSGGQATCTKPAECQVCSKEYGEALGHAYNDGVVITESTCTEDGVMVKTCTRCGDKINIAIPASHKGEWYITAEPRCFDKGEKQRICTVCDAIETEELPAIGHHDLQDATCEEGRACSKCHYVEGEGAGHVFSEWEPTVGDEATCTLEGKESRRCLVCGKKESRIAYAKGHTFDEWTVVTSATCQSTGKESRTCRVCGETVTRTTSKTAHTGEWVISQEPTCTEAGSAYRDCSVCGNHETKTLVATGHKGEWHIQTQATCTQNGLEYMLCDICNKKQTRTIYAAHHYSDWVTETEATCTVAGLKVRTCGDCGKRDTLTISKTSHVGEWTVVTPAKCTEEGVQRQICTECGQVTNKAIAKLGHDLQGGTCTTAAKCSRCDYESEIKGHVFGEDKLIEEPDCARRGYSQKTCDKCGYIETTYTDPIGHNYGEWTTQAAATCLEDGRERRVCTVCNKAEDRVTDALGHNLGEWHFDTAPTCTEKGIGYRECTRCNVSFHGEADALGHDFGGDKCFYDIACVRCGVVESHPHVYGENGCDNCGLEYTTATYTLSRDGRYYIATDLTTNSDGIVFLPLLYKGKSIEIIDGVYNKGSIKVVILPQGVKQIGRSAFASCANLTYIYIPDSVTLLDGGAFSMCSRLTSVKIPNGVTYIDASTFYNCKGLKSVTIPYGVTSIGDSAFALCESLTEILIPNSVVSIERSAFYGCCGLKNITVSDSVATIGEYAFYGCNGISSITYLGTEEQWAAIEKDKNWNPDNIKVVCLG